MLHKGIYSVLFVICVLVPWVSQLVCCYNFTVLVTGIMALSLYALNFSYFIWSLLTMPVHNAAKLGPFSFGCFSCLMFFLLKIEWLYSEFYKEHGGINSMLWLTAHLLSGFGHLMIQIEHFTKLKKQLPNRN